MSGNIMNASVLGMNAQTSWLATISQNIANSSTTGYKDAETEFSSLVNQARRQSIIRPAASPPIRSLRTLCKAAS